MSQGDAAPPSTATWATTSPLPENSTNPPAPAPTPVSAPTPVPKPRSCVVCRNRKVRCDKQSPCTNCRRANIACVYPSNDRPPRWARRLERLTSGAAASNPPVPQEAVMERIRTLESLVIELRGQLEQARKASSSYGGGSSVNSPGSSPQHLDPSQQRETSPASDSNVHRYFGRLVLQDSGRSRYVSSSFWSRVDDELKTHTDDLIEGEDDSSEDEVSPETNPSSTDLERTPADRHGFLFGHNLGAPVSNLSQFHPLPSQLPFLVDVFSENANMFLRIVHIPTIMNMVRDIRSSGMAHLSTSNEALMLSICYAAIVSMEDDDVATNFGTAKAELCNKYRLGLEHALARADFLNNPDTVLVQAFAIFVCLARRHESPKFVWMMAGLLVKMAQYLGLQRDPAHFQNLTPYEAHMRRRIWWVVLWLDQRAGEDQGTDLTIAQGSFDTELPLNINEADIEPSTKEAPAERHGVSDMTFARVQCGVTIVHRDIIIYVNANDRNVDIDKSNELLNETYNKLDEGYLQHTDASEPQKPVHWVMITVARLIKAKLTLIVFLPVLFSSSSDNYSDEVRTKLLICAIEVAEYNHALNTEEDCKQWRWVYQTHIHWHATVYLLLDITRRPWSAMVERAWVALHSKWLIPARTFSDKNLRIWIPLRKLLEKARKHRDAELDRLRADPQAALNLDIADQNMPLPLSTPLYPINSDPDQFRERWRQLVGFNAGAANNIWPSLDHRAGLTRDSTTMNHTTWPPTTIAPPTHISESNHSLATTVQTHNDTNQKTRQRRIAEG